MASYIGSLGETLRIMKFMIKTVYGTSQGYYQSTDQEKLAGTGVQGRRSGASPALWLSLFIVLLILVLAYKRNDQYDQKNMRLVSQEQSYAVKIYIQEEMQV